MSLGLISLSFIVLSLLEKNVVYTPAALYGNNRVKKQVKSGFLRNRSNSEKMLCRSLPDYFNRKNLNLDPKTVNEVEMMLIFIGYPRSGHTLIGSLLDAHPNIVIANEYDILSSWANYTTRHRNKQYLFEQLYTNSYVEAHEGDRSTKDCVPKTKYKYLIPNQWQGKFDGKIKIIGDKKGGKTTSLFRRSQKYWTILEEILQEVKIPIKFIHVVRNPFDNIATMLLRRQFGNNLNWKKVFETPIHLPKETFIRHINYRMKLAMTNAQLIQRFHGRVHTLRNEDMIRNPEIELRKVCRFLDIECSTKYIIDCISIVNSKISKSRNGIVWDKEVKNILVKYIKQIPFYSGYTFDE